MILLVSVRTIVKIIVCVNNLISLSIPIEWVIIINLTTLERSNTMFDRDEILGMAIGFVLTVTFIVTCFVLFSYA